MVEKQENDSIKEYIKRIIEVLSILYKEYRGVRRVFGTHLKISNQNFKILEKAIDDNLNDIVTVSEALKKVAIALEIEEEQPKERRKFLDENHNYFT